jgi:hypothetical protein
MKISQQILGMSGNVIDELKARISVKRITESYRRKIVSFGEYFSSKIIAEHLGAGFIDACRSYKNENGTAQSIMHKYIGKHKGNLRRENSL